MKASMRGLIMACLESEIFFGNLSGMVGESIEFIALLLLLLLLAPFLLFYTHLSERRRSKIFGIDNTVKLIGELSLFLLKLNLLLMGGPIA